MQNYRKYEIALYDIMNYFKVYMDYNRETDIDMKGESITANKTVVMILATQMMCTFCSFIDTNALGSLICTSSAEGKQV